MIEIESSRNGLPILKIEGKLLNSSYDPIREAQSWLESTQGKIEKFDHIIVLGMGSAYHVLELLKYATGKKVRIIENDSELVEKTLSLFSGLKSIEVNVFEEATEIWSSAELLKVIQSCFCVLRMPSSRFLNKAFFDEAEICLSARRPVDFLKVCQAQPAFKAQLDLQKMSTSKLISLQDFSWREEKMTPEYRIFKILKELIK